MRNVRQAVRTMASQASRRGDRLVFVDSSHGNGDGCGNSYLCLLPDPQLGQDDDERTGRYWDRHLAEDLGAKGGHNDGTAFVFLDACYSGGILEELVASLPNSFGSSTCTQKGYGYDESIHSHGAWTQAFLVQGLMRRRAEGGALDLVEVFQEAHSHYVTQHRSRGDRPCCFLNVRQQRYNTNDGDGSDVARLPRGLVHVADVFGP